ncbi:serine/threonine-protein kinase polo-like [Ptychodera flava]|uniref:serine/threonine-protein kinase polo-like n=1 Tax=Ptychodera flava TaxID=63121 RepID=UPI003969DCE4
MSALTLIRFRNSAPLEDASIRHRIGSLPYISPEAVFDNGITSFKEDIWSVGMVLATLFTGLTPYQSELDEPRLHDVHEANEKLPRYHQKPSTNVEMKLYSQQGKMAEQVATLINLSLCLPPGLRPPAKNLLLHLQ